jgi:hypothetical protein
VDTGNAGRRDDYAKAAGTALGGVLRAGGYDIFQLEYGIIAVYLFYFLIFFIDEDDRK